MDKENVIGEIERIARGWLHSLKPGLYSISDDQQVMCNIYYFSGNDAPRLERTKLRNGVEFRYKNNEGEVLLLYSDISDRL